MAGVTDLEPLISSFDVEPGYLDWARFGPLSPSVRAEMHADAELLGSGRPSSLGLVNERAREARALIGTVLGAPEDQIVLQPSTTHGLAHAMFGLEGTVAVPAEDFPSVRVMAHRAAAARGRLAVREFSPPGGVVTADAVASVLTDEVTAVAFSLVDFRTGALADLTAIRDVLEGRLLIVDAMQAFGVVEADWSAADVVAGNGYKWLRAGRGTGFARFSAHARERIAPVLSGISGMVGGATTLGAPAAREGAAAYSVSPSDPLAASRLAAALREITEAGVAQVARQVRERAQEVMEIADRHGVPVLTPRDAHAGIVTLAPAAQETPALAAALANHGVTVTARGATIRVSTHIGTHAGSLTLLDDALADAASLRTVAVDFAGDDLGLDTVAGEPITIELGELPATEN
ncbi:MAG: aminotransferase class V-fold PLP-dependent enzyme [Microbacterium sp.]